MNRGSSAQLRCPSPVHALLSRGAYLHYADPKTLPSIASPFQEMWLSVRVKTQPFRGEGPDAGSCVRAWPAPFAISIPVQLMGQRTRKQLRKVELALEVQAPASRTIDDERRLAIRHAFESMPAIPTSTVYFRGYCT
jgi:hypothetical protein